MDAEHSVSSPGWAAGNRRSVTVIGGGLGGLVAAIRCAEQGVSVSLHEAHQRLGGRARTTGPPFIANDGPHGLYADGITWRFLLDRRIAVPVARPPMGGTRFHHEGRIRRAPPRALLRAYRGMRRPAAVETDFRSWATRRWGDDDAAVLCGAAGVFTYHHDPGELSAAFVAERFVRVFALPPAVRYVRSGWATLVAALERHARTLGVRIETASRVDRLPDPPVIIATELRDAAGLLDDPGLSWTSGTCAVFDVGLRRRRGDPWVVCDIDEVAWVERFSRTDRTLAPPGHELLQAEIGIRPGETLDAALQRLHTTLDAAFPQWRTRLVWSRQARLEAMTGALDYPGTTWRDRPQIDRGQGVFLATDMSAGHGLLSEVTVACALTAADLAVAAYRADSPRSGNVP
jgi:glycine/D-amino acid oxidase-like deaminating enzyme